MKVAMTLEAQSKNKKIIEGPPDSTSGGGTVTRGCCHLMIFVSGPLSTVATLAREIPARLLRREGIHWLCLSGFPLPSATWGVSIVRGEEWSVLVVVVGSSLLMFLFDFYCCLAVKTAENVLVVFVSFCCAKCCVAHLSIFLTY